MLPEVFNAAPNCCIVSTRAVNAAQEKVYEAWTNPDYLKNWWGPAGFTNTFIEYDLRIGGRWKFIMHGPDKGNYPNECEFIKIEKPSLIAWFRISKPLFTVLATFEIISTAKTHIIFKMIFDTPEECDKIKKFVVDKNEENFDRLEAELHKMST
jgi:Activator of Hsp90 ATPase homolog 1-like protein